MNEQDLHDSEQTPTEVSAFAHFEGQLLTDEAALTAAADTFGHIVHDRPLAVLKPHSADDIIRVIQYARKHGKKVTPRGQGHSTQRQAQVEGGIVIEMSALSCIREMDRTSILVDAGVCWRNLVDYTIPQGLTPPTLTDYLGLSIAGTLSVGGTGGQAFRFGMQTDNVLELEVVTGRGDLMRCSREQSADLFNACRAGLGQFGVIVGARLRLVPVPSSLRLYTATYTDVATFLSDQEQLMDTERFDYMEGMLLPEEGGGWKPFLTVGKYAVRGVEPDDRALLAGFAFIPGSVTRQDQSYLDFVKRVDADIPMLKQLGLWEVPHPWIDVFLPSTQAVSFIDGVLKTLTVNDMGAGLILIHPIKRSRCKTPFLRLPDEEHSFQLNLLRNAVPPTAEHVQALIDANRLLYEQSVQIGAKLYPIGSVPMHKSDWEDHFQPRWDQFLAAKRHFDPDHVFTPGQGIF
jgi:FAD/FMN-containing dehydrogenase